MLKLSLPMPAEAGGLQLAALGVEPAEEALLA